MLINREVAGGNGERSEPYAAGGLGVCKPPKKILRFGALRAVLRHYSRIINKTDKKCCFLHFGRGVQDPLSGDQGGVLGPLDPPGSAPELS